MGALGRLMVRSVDSTVQRTLWWVITTPLGVPVVPEVYINVAMSSGWSWAARSSTTPGLPASSARPLSARSSHDSTQSTVS